MTLHETVEAIVGLDRNDPDFALKVTALVKRHVHDDKAGLMHRLMLYCDYGNRRGVKSRRVRNKVTLSGLRFMHETLKSKYETHSHYAKLADEEVVTWSIGRHKYDPKSGKLVLKDADPS